MDKGGCVMPSIFDKWEKASYSNTSVKTANETIKAEDIFKLYEELFKQRMVDESDVFKAFNFGNLYVHVDYTKPELSAQKEAKIKKLEAMISDSSTTSGEKENAKRLIEKIKAGD